MGLGVCSSNKESSIKRGVCVCVGGWILIHKACKQKRAGSHSPHTCPLPPLCVLLWDVVTTTVPYCAWRDANATRSLPSSELQRVSCSLDASSAIISSCSHLYYLHFVFDQNNVIRVGHFSFCYCFFAQFAYLLQLQHKQAVR